MNTYRVTLVDPAANAVDLPEYDPENLTDRIGEIHRPHLVWADRWLPDGAGLWRAGGYILRPGWRIYRPTPTRRTR